MVYALMANGDIYTMGPVLPLHAEVPASYLNSLQAWVGERSQALEAAGKAEPGQEGSAEYASLVGRRQLQETWVAALVKQSAQEDDVVSASSPPRRRGFGLRDSPPSPPRTDDKPPPPPGYVRVHPPHLTASGGPAPGIHRPIMRQGPMLFDPAPQEVGNGDDVDEQSATDIAIVHATGDSDDESGPRVNVLAIAWSSGRVDLGVDAETSEPRWITSRDPASRDLYLPIVESTLCSFTAEDDAIALNAPNFVADPIHPDVLYVAHAFGVDALSVAPWVGQLLEGKSELPPSDVAPLVEASAQKPVVGVVTFCNITLGYGLLALASSGQLAAVEMDVRVPDRNIAAPAPLEVVAPDANSQSLLSKAFDPALPPAKDYNPKAAVRKAPDSHKPLDAITPVHLRALGEAASQVRSRADAISSASSRVEARLDLQVAEYARQLAVLKGAASSVAALRAAAARNAQRAERVLAAQNALGDRLDGVLTALMAEHRPQIGTVERRWFDELERVRTRVNGARGQPGMAARAQVLREQLGVVKPLVKEGKEEKEGELGTRQLRPLQAALGSRGDEIARLMRKMDALSVRVDAMGNE